MEPEISAPKISPEYRPLEYGSGAEQLNTTPSPEAGIETGAESRERAVQAATSIASSGLPTSLPRVAVIPDDNVVTNVSSSMATPLTAGDDDLIEKEWVDRAKKIIDETKEDPYRREEAVNELQRDYQKKRYGRDLGEA
jgi:hypothetical protein